MIDAVNRWASDVLVASTSRFVSCCCVHTACDVVGLACKLSLQMLFVMAVGYCVFLVYVDNGISGMSRRVFCDDCG